MCGSIKRSDNASEAVNFGIAYAFSHVAKPFEGDELGGHAEQAVRKFAVNFIETYTPYGHRNEALKLLAQRTAKGLTTTLNYYDDIVD